MLHLEDCKLRHIQVFPLEKFDFDRTRLTRSFVVDTIRDWFKDKLT